MARPFDFDADYGRAYDEIIRRVFPAYEDLFLMVLATLEPVTREGADVLVAGCGTGMELATFATRRPDWRLTGVDPSAQMLAQAARRVTAAGAGDRVTLHRGTVASLPPAARFDAATLICVLHFVPDDGGKLRLLRDLAVRLEAGAPLVLVDANGQARSPAHERLMTAWMGYVRHRGLSGEEQCGYERQVRDGVYFVTAERIRGLLAEAGFVAPTRFFSAFVFDGWVTQRSGRTPHGEG